MKLLQSLLSEKWGTMYKVAEKEKGKHSDKTLAELRTQLKTAKKQGNTDLVRELNFAIRAKTGWGKVKESTTINEALDEEHLYKQVHGALHPILVKLVNDLGGEDEDMARDILTHVLKEWMQSELVY